MSSGGSPCGACRFLRRKCAPSCIFAPYFDSEQGTNHFATVHKVFGASNVSKLLASIPMHKRLDAVITICFEAQSRLRDPIYGCVGHIFSLQQQVMNLQAELSYLHGHLAQMEIPQPSPPPPQTAASPSLSIRDLPATTVAATMPPSTYDLSSLLDPMGQVSWAMQERAIDPRQHPSTSSVDLKVEATHGSPPASTSN